MKLRAVFMVVAPCAVGCAAQSQSQSRSQAPPPGASADDGRLPGVVRGALDQYVQTLASSRSLEECAQRFTAIAGGGLVSEDGRSLRQT